MSCRVIRKDGVIQKVLTPKGDKSQLFENIAALPFVENKEEALGLYKNLYSNEVREILGDDFYKENNDIILEPLLDKYESNINPLLFFRIKNKEQFEKRDLEILEFAIYNFYIKNGLDSNPTTEDILEILQNHIDNVSKDKKSTEKLREYEELLRDIIPNSTLTNRENKEMWDELQRSIDKLEGVNPETSPELEAILDEWFPPMSEETLDKDSGQLNYALLHKLGKENENFKPFYDKWIKLVDDSTKASLSYNLHELGQIRSLENFQSIRDRVKEFGVSLDLTVNTKEEVHIADLVFYSLSSNSTKEEYREVIDRINKSIIQNIANNKPIDELVTKRHMISLMIAEYKALNNEPIEDKTREAAMLSSIKEQAEKIGADSNTVENIFLEIIEQSKNIQREKLGEEVENKSEDTQDFFSEMVQGDSTQNPKTGWKSLLDFTSIQRKFKEVYEKFLGNFDAHIATSIPTFRETQIKVGTAITSMLNIQPKVVNQELFDIHTTYKRNKGITAEVVYTKNNPKLMKDISEYHDNVEDDRQNAEMLESYEAFMEETKSQYELLVEKGYEIKPYLSKGEPYGVDSGKVRKDLKDNKRLLYLMSRSATGENNEQESAEDYILFRETGIEIDGQPVLFNDLFRAVHDIFGHGVTNNSFSTQGELNAYNFHRTMYSEKAQKALFLETVVYNAYYTNNKKYAQRKIYNIPDMFIESINSPTLVYDIGGSEGSFVKAISEMSEGNIGSINLDPNPSMKEAFDSNPTENSIMITEAFYTGFDNYSKHIPNNKADVVHESMTFQFMGNNRNNYLKEVKENYLKEGGIFLTEEKLVPMSEEQWITNEKNKDENFKTKYYSQEQIAEKSDKVLTDMRKNQVSLPAYKALLLDNFDHIVEYWDAGNFRGIAASDSLELLQELMKKLGGKITSEFSSGTGDTFTSNEKTTVEGLKDVLEPQLRFKGKDGELYESYKEALDVTPSGNIEIGFYVAGKKEFIPIVEVDSNSNTDTKHGFLNFAIRGELIAGARKLIDGVYKLTGAGALEKSRVYNAVMAKLEAYRLLGNKSLRTLGGGYLEFTETPNDSEITLTTESGEEQMTKQELRERLVAGEFEALSKKYPNLTDAVYELYTEDVADNEFDRGETPTVSEQEVQMKLLGLLNKLGVKTMSIANYIANYNTRHGVDPSVEALADINNQIVAFAEGKMTLDNLSEEVAHFLVESFHNQAEVEAVLQQVEETSEWEEFSGAYYQKYGQKLQGEELDNAVRREILGKILAKSLKERFSLQQKTVQQTNVITRLRDMFNNFVESLRSYFNPTMRTELNDLIEKITDLATSNYVEENFNSDNLFSKNSVFYSLQARDLTFVHARDKLETRIRDLRSRQDFKEATRLKEVNNLVEQLEKVDEFGAASELIGNIAPMVRRLRNTFREVNKKQSEGEHVQFNHNDIMDATHAADLFEPIVTELQTFIKDGKIQPVSGGRTDLLEIKMKDILEDIGEVKGLLTTTMRKQIVTTTSDVIKKYRLPEERRNYIENMIQKDMRDITWFQKTYGSLQHASNPFLNILGKIIRQNANRANRKTIKDVKEFLDSVQNEGWNSEKFKTLIKRDEDGQLTRFTKSPINWNKFTNALNDARAAAYSKATGVTISTENFVKDTRNGNIILSELPADVNKVFINEVNNWIEKNTERRYTDEYYNIRKERLEKVSDRTKEWLSNHSQDRFRILQKYYEELEAGEKLDYSKISQSDLIALNELTQMRKAAKNEISNQDGLRKTGEDLELALDLQKLDADFDNSNTQISSEFYETIKRIEETEGSEKAFEWLLLNGGLNFNDTFWDSFEGGQTLQDRLDKVISDLENTNPAMVDSVSDRGGKLVELLNRRKQILKQFQTPNNPAEIDISTMGDTTMTLIAETEEAIQDAFTELNRVLRDSSLPEISPNEVQTETTVNQSYVDSLVDSKKNEIDFILDHTIRNGVKDILNMRSLLENVANGNPQSITKGQKKVLSNLLGISDVTTKSLRAELATTSVDVVLAKYGRTKVLPYFRRFAPAGYSAFLANIKVGNTSVVDMINRIEEGNPQGVEQYVEVNSKFSWTDDLEGETHKNPRYNENFKGGRLQPKLDTYMDESFFSEFEVSREEFMNHKEFTGGNQSFKMLQQLWDVKFKAMEQYKNTDSENMYKIPQFSKQTTEKMKDMLKLKTFTTLANAIKDLTQTRVDTAETGVMLNGKELSKLGDTKSRVLIKYGLTDLEEISDISSELAATYTRLLHSANEFAEKENTLSDVMVLQQGLMDSSIGGRPSQDRTRAYKMFDEFVDAYFYGIKRTKTWKVDIFGAPVDLSKMLMRFDRLVRMINIGFSIPVALTSYTTARLFGKQEAIVGEYYTPSSSRWAGKELNKLLPNYIKDSAKIVKENKLLKLGEVFGVFDLGDRLKASGFSRTSRLFLNNMPYKFSEMANIPVAPKAMLSVLDDIRFVDGKFMDFEEYKSTQTDLSKKELTTKWNEHRENSLYNNLEESEGTFVIKPDIVEKIGKEASEQILDDATNRIATVVEAIDSIVSPQDKSAATRDFLLNFTTAHRGWFTILFQRKLKRKHFNTITNREEEGHMMTLARVMRDTFKGMRENNHRNVIKEIKKNWSTLDDFQKRNLRRMGVESVFYMTMLLATALVAGMADDDENKDVWAIQLGTYIMYRTASELGTASFPLNTVEALEIAEKPFMALNTINEITDFSEWTLEPVERGVFEGDTKLYRKFAKLTWLKHWYQMKDVRAVRQQFVNTNQGTLLGLD